MKRNKTTYNLGMLLTAVAFSFVSLTARAGSYEPQTYDTGQDMDQYAVEYTDSIYIDTNEPPFMVLDDDQRDAALDDILSHYTAWEVCEISGKLRADGLPLSPSLKIYMKRGTDLVISVRAPFVGEVMRLDLDSSCLLLVNKLKKVYCRESVDNLMRVYPGLCGDIQSLLLGRIVVPGYGELSAENEGQVIIALEPEGDMMVVPGLDDLPLNVMLAYLTDNIGVLERVLVQDESRRTVFQMLYDIDSKGNAQLSADISKKGKVTHVEIDLNAPVAGGSKPAPFSPNDKYRKVGIKDFLKSF